MNWLFYKQLQTCFPGAHDSRRCQGPDAQTVCCNGGGPGYHQGEVITSLDMHAEPLVCPQRTVHQIHICRAVLSKDTIDSWIGTFSECVRFSPYYLFITSILLCPRTCLLCLSLENMHEACVIIYVFKERHVLSPKPS